MAVISTGKGITELEDMQEQYIGLCGEILEDCILYTADLILLF